MTEQMREMTLDETMLFLETESLRLHKKWEEQIKRQGGGCAVIDIEIPRVKALAPAKDGLLKRIYRWVRIYRWCLLVSCLSFFWLCVVFMRMK